MTVRSSRCVRLLFLRKGHEMHVGCSSSSGPACIPTKPWAPSALHRPATLYDTFEAVHASNLIIGPMLAVAGAYACCPAVQEVEGKYPIAMEESYLPTKVDEVDQLLTRLASTGTAACRLDDAFCGNGLPTETEPQEWRDELEEGEATPCAKAFLLV